MSWAVSSVALVHVVLSAVIGFGAAAIVGHEQITAADPQGKTPILLVSRAVMGADVSRLREPAVHAMATAIFLTLLASVAGITLACANTLAHDRSHGLRRKGMRP